ncbi:MAG: methionyl-tRNA formyltransferase [Thermogemmatispora sp.]|uniref:methionyl-tRNA formyltransferase n=1 Tax=Thermogemmatispora sp. TaxID=1968838 RepID=UPI0019FEE106|nr:methionyl-tRNA formyltransferase [Thermogemmatispora sp.]MBE3564434.1 methionyl-tRNA formyltransferase [Thermogemmatispora sp.]
MLRVIYMGTPQFAVPPLEALIRGARPGAVLAEGYEIVAVITRTDKPVGRGHHLAFSPVKQVALAHGLHVWQPGSLKRPETIEALAAYHADLYIVTAFGQILPQAVLDQPRYGTLNIHASLLPKYRGVSPISEAILQGESETGVTIMLLDAGIDTGPILHQRRLPIDPDDTTETLSAKLAELGATALLETLPRWIAGEITPQPQDESQASYTRMLRKEDGQINWQRPAIWLARMVRAYTPWPGSYTFWRGKLLKILKATALSEEQSPLPRNLPPGTVHRHTLAGEELLAIACGEGWLLVSHLQLEGRKAISAAEFLRGYPQIVGSVLGPSS